MNNKQNKKVAAKSQVKSWAYLGATGMAGLALYIVESMKSTMAGQQSTNGVDVKDIIAIAPAEVQKQVENFQEQQWQELQELVADIVVEQNNTAQHITDIDMDWDMADADLNNSEQWNVVPVASGSVAGGGMWGMLGALTGLVGAIIGAVNWGKNDDINSKVDDIKNTLDAITKNTAATTNTVQDLSAAELARHGSLWNEHNDTQGQLQIFADAEGQRDVDAEELGNQRASLVDEQLIQFADAIQAIIGKVDHLDADLDDLSGDHGGLSSQMTDLDQDIANFRVSNTGLNNGEKARDEAQNEVLAELLEAIQSLTSSEEGTESALLTSDKFIQELEAFSDTLVSNFELHDQNSDAMVGAYVGTLVDLVQSAHTQTQANISGNIPDPADQLAALAELSGKLAAHSSAIEGFGSQLGDHGSTIEVLSSKVEANTGGLVEASSQLGGLSDSVDGLKAAHEADDAEPAPTPAPELGEDSGFVQTIAANIYIVGKDAVEYGLGKTVTVLGQEGEVDFRNIDMKFIDEKTGLDYFNANDGKLDYKFTQTQDGFKIELAPEKSLIPETVKTIQATFYAKTEAQDEYVTQTDNFVGQVGAAAGVSDYVVQIYGEETGAAAVLQGDNLDFANLIWTASADSEQAGATVVMTADSFKSTLAATSDPSKLVTGNATDLTNNGTTTTQAEKNAISTAYRYTSTDGNGESKVLTVLISNNPELYSPIPKSTTANGTNHAINAEKTQTIAKSTVIENFEDGLSEFALTEWSVGVRVGGQVEAGDNGLKISGAWYKPYDVTENSNFRFIDNGDELFLTATAGALKDVIGELNSGSKAVAFITDYDIRNTNGETVGSLENQITKFTVTSSSAKTDISTFYSFNDVEAAEAASISYDMSDYYSSDWEPTLVQDVNRESAALTTSSATASNVDSVVTLNIPKSAVDHNTGASKLIKVSGDTNKDGTADSFVYFNIYHDSMDSATFTQPADGLLYSSFATYNDDAEAWLEHASGGGLTIVSGTIQLPAQAGFILDLTIAELGIGSADTKYSAFLDGWEITDMKFLDENRNEIETYFSVDTANNKIEAMAPGGQGYLGDDIKTNPAIKVYIREKANLANTHEIIREIYDIDATANVASGYRVIENDSLKYPVSSFTGATKVNEGAATDAQATLFDRNTYVVKTDAGADLHSSANQTKVQTLAQSDVVGVLYSDNGKALEKEVSSTVYGESLTNFEIAVATQDWQPAYDSNTHAIANEAEMKLFDTVIPVAVLNLRTVDAAGGLEQVPNAADTALYFLTKLSDFSSVKGTNTDDATNDGAYDDDNGGSNTHKLHSYGGEQVVDMIGGGLVLNADEEAILNVNEASGVSGLALTGAFADKSVYYDEAEKLFKIDTTGMAIGATGTLKATFNFAQMTAAKELIHGLVVSATEPKYSQNDSASNVTFTKGAETQLPTILTGGTTDADWDTLGVRTRLEGEENWTVRMPTDIIKNTKDFIAGGNAPIVLAYDHIEAGVAHELMLITTADGTIASDSTQHVVSKYIMQSDNPYLLPVNLFDKVNTPNDWVTAIDADGADDLFVTFRVSSTESTSYNLYDAIASVDAGTEFSLSTGLATTESILATSADDTFTTLSTVTNHNLPQWLTDEHAQEIDDNSWVHIVENGDQTALEVVVDFDSGYIYFPPMISSTPVILDPLYIGWSPSNVTGVTAYSTGSDVVQAFFTAYPEDGELLDSNEEVYETTYFDVN